MITLRPALTVLFAASLVITGLHGHSQARVSIASDFNIQRSFKKGQEYWAPGQVVAIHFNFTPADAAYAWVAYFASGRFTNTGLLAQIKDPVSVPFFIRYDNRTKMRFKHVSIGWKHYYKGSALAERGLGVYSLAGLGILIGQVNNTQSVSIDTSLYHLPVLPGTAAFHRLTLDLGAGIELPLGADLYLYSELKTILPLTDYPSPYILDNKYTPYTGMASVGFRILFN